jgi:hypothetical protein
MSLIYHRFIRNHRHIQSFFDRGVIDLVVNMSTENYAPKEMVSIIEGF